MLWTKYLTQTNKILIQKTSNIVLQKRTISKPVRRSRWEQKLNTFSQSRLMTRCRTSDERNTLLGCFDCQIYFSFVIVLNHDMNLPEEHINGKVGGWVDAEKKYRYVCEFGVPARKESRWRSAVNDGLIDGAKAEWRLWNPDKKVKEKYEMAPFFLTLMYE